MKIPFFSVVIPTYNQSNFLKKALNSLTEQSYKNFEIIVIDNYSKDKTNKIIDEFPKKIIYRRIKNYGNIARSRNVGIKLSKGKWICFLDSDDYWLKDKLKEIFKLIKKKKLDVICHSEHVINKEINKKKIWHYGPYVRNFYQTLLKKGNRFSTSASCVRKKFILQKKIKFEERKSFITAEDYSFFLHLAFHNANFFFLNKPLGCRLIHSKSYSKKILFHLRAVSDVLKYHVYKVQNFNKNKSELWREIENNFLIRKNLFVYDYKNRFFKKYVKIFKLFLKYPKNNLSYFYYLIQKKIRYLF